MQEPQPDFPKVTSNRDLVKIFVGLTLIVVAIYAFQKWHESRDTIAYDYMTQRADSLYHLSVANEKIIFSLQKSIDTKVDTIRIIRELQPIRYEKYITNYAVLRPDSTIKPHFARAEATFDSLFAEGFFTRK